jgi:hypothetical protein
MHNLIWEETILVDDRAYSAEYAEHLETAYRENFRPLTYTEYVEAVRRAVAKIDQLMEARYGKK